MAVNSSNPSQYLKMDKDQEDRLVNRVMKTMGANKAGLPKDGVIVCIDALDDAIKQLTNKTLKPWDQSLATNLQGQLETMRKTAQKLNDQAGSDYLANKP